VLAQMKPPIIADNRGDILVFDTPTQAASYMEPIDVRNNEYRVFDSEGRLILPEVDSNGRRERTTLKDAELVPTHEGEVRSLLLRALAGSRSAAPGMDAMNLTQLFDLMPRTR
jgi:hypothetical protein